MCGVAQKIISNIESSVQQQDEGGMEQRHLNAKDACKIVACKILCDLCTMRTGLQAYFYGENFEKNYGGF